MFGWNVTRESILLLFVFVGECSTAIPRSGWPVTDVSGPLPPRSRWPTAPRGTSSSGRARASLTWCLWCPAPWRWSRTVRCWPIRTWQYWPILTNHKPAPNIRWQYNIDQSHCRWDPGLPRDQWCLWRLALEGDKAGQECGTRQSLDILWYPHHQCGWPSKGKNKLCNKFKSPIKYYFTRSWSFTNPSR